MLLRFIRTWYEKMSLRERVMFLAFVWGIVLIWFIVLAHQLAKLRDAVHATQHDTQNQKLVLDQEQVISTKLSQMLSKFDKANVINASQLFGLVAQFAKDSNLPNAQVTQQHVGQTSDIFKVNTVNVHFVNASLHDLVLFASRIEDRTPYLAIDDMSLTPNPINPTLLEATMRVSSLELNLSDVKH
jgi:hypothetical protein